MTRNTYVFCFLVLALAGLAGCSSEPPAQDQAAAAPDKIQGKAQVVLNETTASDAAMNAGGPSVYLVDGLNRYRLFFNKAFQVEPGKEYIAEGVYAQKAIDAIGDPDQGKNGYPLESSCGRVVRMAWPGLAFDVADSYSNSLRAKVKRFPARPVFLVTQIQPVTADSAKQKEDAGAGRRKSPEVSVPADKQRALLVEGPTVLPAPLWEPAGGTVRCKVVIDEEGKIAELDSGAQLCETVPWSQFRYQAHGQGRPPGQSEYRGGSALRPAKVAARCKLRRSLLSAQPSLRPWRPSEAPRHSCSNADRSVRGHQGRHDQGGRRRCYKWFRRASKTQARQTGKR